MEQHIEIINNWNLRKVFEELENGNFKVPRFQRGYVWERPKIVKLLNSIYSQFPIGSFFIWVASQDYKNFCREIDELGLPEEPQSNVYSFILDGQQRITSLYVALRGKILNNTDYASICFNLERKLFQIPRLKNEKHNIPAWKLFNTIQYGEVYKQYTLYDIDNKTSLADAWRECQQVFSDYPISIIKSLKMNLDQVVTIFERINQGGKRLSLFDLVHASAWSPNFDLRERIKEFNKEQNVFAFGGLDEETFTQALTLNIFGDAKNQNQLKLTAENCLQNWEDTKNCLKLAMDFIRSFGVRYADFIPYNSFLPVVQLYFFKSKFKSVKIEHKAIIEDWFWTSTFSQRYSSSSLTKMKEDADWILDLVKGKINDNTFAVALTIKELKKVRMQNNSAIKNGVLCLMALQIPRDFNNGQIVILDRTQISRSNSKENHHFFPYSLRLKFAVSANQINCILNFAFISSGLNRQISNKLPSDYVRDYSIPNKNFRGDLTTHFIDEGALQAISKNDYDGFINERGKNILEMINKVTRGKLVENESDVSDDVEIEEEIENEVE